VRGAGFTVNPCISDPATRGENMPDPQPENLSFSASISAARGKLITTLAGIALLMDIAAEALSLLTGFYNLRKNSM
jgi:hypothetical protein